MNNSLTISLVAGLLLAATSHADRPMPRGQSNGGGQSGGERIGAFYLQYWSPTWNDSWVSGRTGLWGFDILTRGDSGFSGFNAMVGEFQRKAPDQDPDNFFRADAAFKAGWWFQVPYLGGYLGYAGTAYESALTGTDVIHRPRVGLLGRFPFGLLVLHDPHHLLHHFDLFYEAWYSPFVLNVSDYDDTDTGKEDGAEIGIHYRHDNFRIRGGYRYHRITDVGGRLNERLGGGIVALSFSF